MREKKKKKKFLKESKDWCFTNIYIYLEKKIVFIFINGW